MIELRTVAALLSGSGRGAVATIVVDGPLALDYVSRCFEPASKVSVLDLSLNLTYFGTWRWRNTSEELVICRTAPDQVEVHCHGGRVAAGNILDSLTSAGVVEISAEEWWERTEPDFYVRQAKRLIPAAKTTTTLAILLAQVRGAMRQQLAEIQGLLDAGRVEDACSRLERLIAFSSVGAHLTKPWSIVLTGPPNTGKSSMINAILGFQRAVVFDQPGTTRDLVSATTAIDGWPVLITDTAGIRESNDPIESEGVRLAKSALANADVVVSVQDLTIEPQNPVTAPSRAINLVVGTKLDLVAGCDHRCDVMTSALTGQGISELMQLVSHILVPDPPGPEDAVPLCESTTALLRQCLQNLDDGDQDEAFRVLAQLRSR